MRIYRQDIRMESELEKSAIHIMKNGKRQMTDRTEQSNQGKIKTLGEKDNYDYLKKLKENLDRTRSLLKTKLYNKNLIKEINNWAVLLVIYLVLFLKWAKEELQQMVKRTKIYDGRLGLSFQR